MRMMGRDAIAIVPAASVKQRNNDVEYHYRQDSDFQYLTGFGEPEAVAVLVPHRPQGEYVLFVRDATRPGKPGTARAPARRARSRSTEPMTPFDRGHRRDPPRPARALLARVLHDGRAPRLRPAGVRLGQRPARPAKKGLHTPQEFVALDHLLHEMRLFKSRAELGAMRRAGEIAAQAHCRAMKSAAPGAWSTR